jgi:hypothetical protein
MNNSYTNSTASLASLIPTIVAKPSIRGGLDLAMPDLDRAAAPAVSETWTMGQSWTLQFASLPPMGRMTLDDLQGKVHLKVITGSLPSASLSLFAPPLTVRSTQVSADIIEAGPDGARIAILVELPTAPATIHSMDALRVNGPQSDRLTFARFDETELGRQVPAFQGLDAHFMPAFHILDTDGTQILFFHIWTTGKGVDLTPHDHSGAPTRDNPAFVETHWVFNNGTGRGGMYACDAQGQDRQGIVIQRGEEHGPFFKVDPARNALLRRDDGSILYGFHGWQAGNDDQPGQAYDVVGAFELNPDYARF